MSDDPDEPSIVGRIAPPVVDGIDDQSNYTIIGKYDNSSAEAQGARPCAHRTFVLDEKWKTVSCKTCGEKLDPYAVLLHFADRWAEFDRRRQSIEHAERDLLASELRRYHELATTTDEEKHRIKRLLTFGIPYLQPARAEHLAELRKFCDELSVLTRERRRHRKEKTRRNA